MTLEWHAVMAVARGDLRGDFPTIIT